MGQLHEHEFHRLAFKNDDRLICTPYCINDICAELTVIAFSS
jgi:hypothetical protein